MTVPNIDHTIDAVLHTLRAATGKSFGDGAAPDGERTTPTMPYGIVQMISATADGDTGQPSGMIMLVVQITTVAPTRKGATALAARIYQVMLTAGPTGYSTPIVPAPPTVVISRRHDSSGGTDRDGTLFNAPERYLLTLATV